VTTSFSFVSYTGNGTTQTFNVPFQYISRSHVEVRLAGLLRTTGISWDNDSTIRLNPAPLAGEEVRIYRNTPKTSALVDFQDAGILTESALDLNTRQSLLVVQEAFDEASNVVSTAVEAAVAAAKLLSRSDIVLSSARVLGRLTPGPGEIEEIPIANPTAAFSIGINRAADQVTVGGTAVEFTNIPAGVRRVTLLLRDVSLSGTDNFLVQIGAGFFLTGGYLSQAQSIRTNDAPTSSQATNGFILSSDTNFAVRFFTGKITLDNFSGNIWLSNGSIVSTDGARGAISSGEVGLPGALDRLRLTVTGGNIFDAGTVNILWEF